MNAEAAHLVGMDVHGAQAAGEGGEGVDPVLGAAAAEALQQRPLGAHEVGQLLQRARDVACAHPLTRRHWMQDKCCSFTHRHWMQNKCCSSTHHHWMQNKWSCTTAASGAAMRHAE